jgi:hypothetical protein
LYVLEKWQLRRLWPLPSRPPPIRPHSPIFSLAQIGNEVTFMSLLLCNLWVQI